ncbi:30S ribosomal protein S21 [Patescibacteria group bacterium]|nr:30S ribosomal protein S21 [Patescibacteria group bacterium]
MVYSKRKKGETFEAFIRRFNKRLMQSGLLLQAKKIRFFKGDVNRNMRRKSALVKKEKRETHEYMKKIGRLPEEPQRRRRY